MNHDILVSILFGVKVIKLPDGVELHQRFKSVHHLGVVPVGRLCLMTRKTQRLKIKCCGKSREINLNISLFYKLLFSWLVKCKVLVTVSTVHVSPELHLELKYRDLS